MIHNQGAAEKSMAREILSDFSGMERDPDLQQETLDKRLHQKFSQLQLFKEIVPSAFNCTFRKNLIGC